MDFSNLEFLFLYLAIAILVYYITPSKFRNITLLILSLLFYGWREPVYIFAMIFAIIVSYIFGWGISVYKEKNNEKAARILVIISIILNLGILIFFKCAGFFTDNIILPIGLSFYILQTISYIFDIYNGNAKVQKNIANFGLYIAMFPKLILGPIVKYKDIDGQIHNRKESVAMFSGGARTFICGLCKKVLFANTAGAFWVYIKALPDSDITVVGAWLGIIAFGLQLYFTFSGYADMAIGLGKMFGFTFLENFNYPYISKSITEFWQRWHISLAAWFKEYVYIPLSGGGKNKKGLVKQYGIIAVILLLIGFWHGASLNYIIWGAYFGIILILEKGFILNILKKAPAFLSHIYFIILIIFGWLIFAFEDMNKGLGYLGKMVGVSAKGFIDTGAVYDLIRYLPFFILAIIGSTPLPKKLFNKIKSANIKIRKPANIATAIISMLLIFSFGILFWIMPDKKISEDENRSLQQFPTFSIEKFIDGKFANSMTKYYADQFPFRDTFVGAKTLLNYASFINDNNNIIIAKDGYLIQRFDKYSEKTISEKSSSELGGDLTFSENMNNIKNNCGYINTFYDNIKNLYPDINFTFAVPPRKIDVMTTELPAFFPVNRNKEYFTELEKYINQDIYFSLPDVLRPHNGEYIYYKTDHHWTTLGAYYAYASLGAKMGYEPFIKDSFEIETATEDFYGTSWSKAGAKWIKPDRIEYYNMIDYLVYGGQDMFYTKIYGAEEKTLQWFYDRDKLNTKDKYSSFLGGINSRISVYVSDRIEFLKPRKKLLLIADSFAQSLAPFLAMDYDIEIIDMRFFNDNIYDFIKEYNITDILILTNMENLSTQNNLIKLTRK